MLIYKTTNLVNGMIYIGQTYKSSSSNYLGSGKLLIRAIKKNGRKNFKRETIVEGNFNQALIDELEIHYIRLYNSNNRNVGYNLLEGGKGNTPEQNINISKNNIGKKLSKESRRKISIAHKGKKLSEEHKLKISNRLLGNNYRLGIPHTQETKEKLRITSTNSAKNPYVRKRQSEGSLEVIKRGKNYIMNLNTLERKELARKGMIKAKEITGKKIRLINIKTNENIFLDSINDGVKIFNTDFRRQCRLSLKTGKLYKNMYKIERI